MIDKRTIIIFAFLVLTIVLQEIANRTFGESFLLGIVPTLIFGTIWNYWIGKLVYKKTLDKQDLNIKRFRVVSFLSVCYLLTYIILFNVFVWPRTE